MILTVKENAAIDKVPVQLQKYLVAKFKPVIKSYEDYDLERAIKNMVIISFAELGIKDAGDDKVVTFLCETLLKDFRSPKFEHVTLEEIKLFISNGIRGEYGTFNGQMNTLNIQNIHFWIKSGMASKDRENALKEFAKQLDAQTTSNKPLQMTPAYFRRAALSAFEDYKTDGTLPFFPHVVYDTINALIGQEYNVGTDVVKTLITNKVQRSHLYLKAKADHLKKKEKPGKKSTPQTLEELFDRQERSFEFLVKRYYLIEFFNQLISENKNLELPTDEQIPQQSQV